MADNDDIPFNRDFPLKPGVVEEVRPGVRRVLCDNPSPFTFTGTVSYIVGKGMSRSSIGCHEAMRRRSWTPCAMRP
jgi:hypothetical protein